MIQKNRYFSCSKISEAKFREILRSFAMDLTAANCSGLERHLNAVVSAVEAACSSLKGQPIDVMSEALVNTFVEAKMSAPDVSKALYAVAQELASADAVTLMTQRSQIALCDMLATASDATFNDLRVVSYMLSTALVGPVQGLLHTAVPLASVQLVKAQLVVMTTAYLKQARSCLPDSTAQFSAAQH